SAPQAHAPFNRNRERQEGGVTRLRAPARGYPPLDLGTAPAAEAEPSDAASVRRPYQGRASASLPLLPGPFSEIPARLAPAEESPQVRRVSASEAGGPPPGRGWHGTRAEAGTESPPYETGSHP